MQLLIGLFMISGQIIAIVKMFGGLKKTPVGIDVATGIALVIMLLTLLNIT